MSTIGPASVQYGDMKGTVAADMGDHENFFHFAKANGVDTDRYFPIAVSFYSGGGDFESITIFAIDKSVASSFDEVEQYAREHEGKVPTSKFDTEAKIVDLLRHFKRFNCVMSLRFKDATEIECEDGPL